MSTVDETLAERGQRYGAFTDHARIAQRLQEVMRESPASWGKLADDQKQALSVIADKIARILNGDPNYSDNWHDIMGYAKLVDDRLVAGSKATIMQTAPLGKQPHESVIAHEQRIRAIGEDAAQPTCGTYDPAPKSQSHGVLTPNAPAVSISASAIYTEVALERMAQDAQWGGPEHDDKYASDDFARYITRQLNKMVPSSENPLTDPRGRFIKIAALAVAAVESRDRRCSPYRGATATPNAVKGNPEINPPRDTQLEVRLRYWMANVPVDADAYADMLRAFGRLGLPPATTRRVLDALLGATSPIELF